MISRVVESNNVVRQALTCPYLILSHLISDCFHARVWRMARGGREKNKKTEIHLGSFTLPRA